MKRSIKKFMLTALLLCVTVLLGSCSFWKESSSRRYKIIRS